MDRVTVGTGSVTLKKWCFAPYLLITGSSGSEKTLIVRSMPMILPPF
jgi:hypothetical protein